MEKGKEYNVIEDSKNESKELNLAHIITFLNYVFQHAPSEKRVILS